MSRAALRGVAFSLAALLCLHASPRAALAGDEEARAKFLADGDVKALAAALADSKDPADRADAAFAAFAVDPASGGPVGGAAGALLTAVAALRDGSLVAARAAANEAQSGGGLAASWLAALLLARGGDADAAEARIAAAPAPAPADAFQLALLGAALLPLDRAALARVAEGAVARVAAAGRLADAAAIGEAAVRVDAVVGADALVVAARALRRGGKALEALNLLVGPAAARAGLGLPALRLDRAVSRRRVGDAAGAAGEAKAVASPAETSWAFEGLARSEGAAPAVAGPPVALAPDVDTDAAALARLATCLGAPTDAAAVVRAAATRGVAASDAAFAREFLAEKGLASVEVAGDAALVLATLARGTPVLVRRIARRGPRAREASTVLRAHDAACGLCLADEGDPRALDVFPVAWLAKSRALIAVEKAKAPDLDALRGTPAGRLGVLLADAVAGKAPEKAAAALLARSAEFPGRPVLDTYAAYLASRTAEPGVPERSPATAAVAYAALSRGAAVPPKTAAECVALAESRSDAGDFDGALALLAEARRAEGDGVDLRLLEFGLLSIARRREEASAALEAALVRAPLDARALLFRGAVRADLGDVEGARADWRRCLDARPDNAVAAESLVNSYLREGALGGAFAAVESLEAAQPKGSQAAATLRRRVEVRALDAARSPRDLLPYARSPLAATRVDVASLLARMEARDAEPELRLLLADPDEAVRRRAAMAYARPDFAARAAAVPPALAALVAASSKDLSPAVREAATVALARVPGEAGETALLARFADPSPAVRAAVADVLFGRDSPNVRTALVAALTDGDLSVRRTVARALVSIAGTDRGFVPDAPTERRAAAIASWKAWLAGN